MHFQWVRKILHQTLSSGRARAISHRRCKLLTYMRAFVADKIHNSDRLFARRAINLIFAKIICKRTYALTSQNQTDRLSVKSPTATNAFGLLSI